MEHHHKSDLLQFFKCDHLPEELQKVSKPFCDLACSLVETLPENCEKEHALHRLLEAKDCAVRAFIFKQCDPEPQPEPVPEPVPAPEEKPAA